MKVSSNVLLVSASGLLFAAAALVLYLQAPHCKRLGQVKAQQVITYVRERYQIPGAEGLSVTEDHLLNDSCTREITMMSAAWHGARSFFLSADQNYLSTTASDLRAKSKSVATTAAVDTPLPFAGLTSVAAPTEGDSSAPATLVEFSDFECPFCSRFAHVLNTDLSGAERRKIKVEFHFFPLPFHPWAEKAAEEAYCVSQQSQPAFWQLHDDLFEHQRELNADTLTPHVEAFVHEKGLSVSAVRACTASGQAHDAVASDIALGKRYGVAGTPTSFLNGKRIVGARTAIDLKHALDAAIVHPSLMIASAQPKS